MENLIIEKLIKIEKIEEISIENLQILMNFRNLLSFKNID